MKILKIISLILLLLLVTGVVVYYLQVRMDAPDIPANTHGAADITHTDSTYRAANGSWLRKNDKGLWEMSLQGAPYERGVAFGALAAASGLIQAKEKAFVGEIQNRIPSPAYLNFLKYMVGWFNRDLDEYVPTEYLQEIYGSSLYMPDSFDYISPKFHRALSYHAAHDIGHALQNMNMVGCTSFATWDQRSADSTLLIGRNFDFYFGQAFAKDKIVAFFKPDSGYQFMSVTWACFSGVVSGINEEGLTVTLNSAKSAIPTKGKTPVSIIAREILQYASTIEEAYEIASRYESFVAETFLIGSKHDGEVGLIEKSPEHTSLYRAEGDEMVITNHFQSSELKNDPLNIEYEAEEVSGYRYARVKQLMDANGPLSARDMVAILRDKNGLDGVDIGLANEKAINQLIAHHAIVFAPEKMMVWVSTPPYQLGDFIAYDLNRIFGKGHDTFTYTDSLSFEDDKFLHSAKYQDYEDFVRLKERIQHFLMTGRGTKLTQQEVDRFIESNPDGFLTYYYLGDYMLAVEDYQSAIKYFELGLTKEIARVSERKHMEEGLRTAKEEVGDV